MRCVIKGPYCTAEFHFIYVSVHKILILITYPLMPLMNTHADVSSVAGDLNFGMNLNPRLVSDPGLQSHLVFVELLPIPILCV